MDREHMGETKARQNSDSANFGHVGGKGGGRSGCMLDMHNFFVGPFHHTLSRIVSATQGEAHGQRGTEASHTKRISIKMGKARTGRICQARQKTGSPPTFDLMAREQPRRAWACFEPDQK